MHAFITTFVMLGLLVACSGSSQPAPPALAPRGQVTHSYTGDGPKLVVLGDSLTVRSWNETYNDVTNDHAVMAGAWEGESYDGGPLSSRLGGLLIPQTGRHRPRPCSPNEVGSATPRLGVASAVRSCTSS